MDRRYIIGGTLVGLLALIFIWRMNASDNTPKIVETTPTPTVNIETLQTDLENTLGVKVSANAEKISLNDVKDLGYTGIATRAQDKDVLELSVLSDLEEKDKGAYQVWAGKDSGSLVSLGTLVSAKGGYLFEFRKGSAKMEDYKNIVVSYEQKVDASMEEKVLEGSF